MLQEVHVLRLRHRNLVNFHHVWLENSKLTNFGPPVPTLYLLQEVSISSSSSQLIIVLRWWGSREVYFIQSPGSRTYGCRAESEGEEEIKRTT